MTAAVELGPELQAAIDAAVEAKVQAHLALVPAGPERPLSMLPASVRRRECERRKAEEARRSEEIDRDRSEGLSMLPASVRRREWERRRAAAKKAPIDRPPMYLQDEAYEEHAKGVPRSDGAGPLAGDVAEIVDRGKAREKLELARLYGEIRKALFEGSRGRIRLPRIWARLKTEKADARKLLAEFGLGQIKAAAHSLGETWKPSEQFPRPTVSLILWRLEVWRAGSRPAKRADSRRMTGEDLEERARRMVAPKLPRSSQMPGNPKNEERAVEPGEAAQQHHERQHLGPFHGSSASTRMTPASPPTGPVQIAAPSPATSAEALAVLDLVNATAARCRAFRGRP